MLPDIPSAELIQGGLLRAESERGICRVICFSPRHDLALPDMDLSEVQRVVDEWAEETTDLGDLKFIGYSRYAG